MFPAKTSSRRAKKSHALEECLMVLPGLELEPNPVAEAVRQTLAAPQANTPALWPKLESRHFDFLTGDVVKYEANLEAIELLRTLESSGRAPDETERERLNRFTGWGGLPQAFNENQNDPHWVARALRLKRLLNEEEYRSAKESTLNAHFTRLDVIETMWAMVQKMGFEGGRVLEPAAGIGYFLGAMPQTLARNSQITAVELDEMSARILRVLYERDNVRVIHEAFEKAPLPERFYDLIIGNVPFGNYSVPCPRNRRYSNFSIHNYFFAHGLELLRPGGIMVLITSSYLLDALSNKVRAYLSNRARLIAAFRLPEGVFSRIAGCRVSTDLIVMQRYRTDEEREDNESWLNTIPAYEFAERMGCGDLLRSVYQPHRNLGTVNRYFLEHPDHLLGPLGIVDTGYGKRLACEGEHTAWDGTVKKIPEAIYLPATEALCSATITLARNESAEVMPGYMIHPHTGDLIEILYGRQYRTLNDLIGKKRERILGLIELRDLARALVQAQYQGQESEQTLRAQLNACYDQFVARFGPIHLRANRMAMRNDPGLAILLSLEHWDEAREQAEKADIFFMRTLGPHEPPERCDSLEEAVQVSLGLYARIELSTMAALLGQSPEEVRTQLLETGLAFVDPLTGRIVCAEEYLCGNVREKLRIAQASGPEFARNVEALSKIIPEDLTPNQIEARVGATWIPAHYYGQFLDELLGIENTHVSFDATAGAWHVEPMQPLRWNLKATQTWGTDRVRADELFAMALNQIVPTVYERDPFSGESKVSPKETLAAREKQDAIKEAFKTWLWSDAERAATLVRHYNDTMNAVVERRYDGSHLVLPGFSKAVSLYPHQKDAIWRILSSGKNTLLGHCVGAGKTLVMICAAMELRRIGKAGKPMIVVPNHMLEQVGREFLMAYPSANILLASKDDLVAERRKVLLSRIATGNWDAIIITHSSFERIKLGDEILRTMIKEELSKIEEALTRYEQEQGNRIVKELVRQKKRWESRLLSLSAEHRKDEHIITFEQLGIDWLFVDEAHLFKNLFRFSKMTRVAGLPMSNSERAFDLYCKTRYLMAQRSDEEGIVFATGTPIANSMAELWVMQNFLQPKTLERYGWQMFDSWAGNFGESVTALELAPDGSGYRMQTRFARFVNLPELMSVFREIADIRTASMLQLPVPEVVAETLSVPCSPELRAYMQTLVERAEYIRRGGIDPRIDNMLKVTNDGRKAALDMRLVDPCGGMPQSAKVLACATKVVHYWRESEAQRGTQIVFCDLSTPAQDGRFNVYHELRRLLIDGGIPREQIAFIHDYESDSAKEELFAAVREGRVRVLIGSTSKMGVGTNVQTRLVALHHLDAPWRPADIEQREGRIARQGNHNAVVHIIRYVTEGSFDAYIWQTLENKARFIAQVMQGGTLRSAEEIELAALSYAEVKALASGNPLVLEKAGVDAEVAKLSILKAQHEKTQWNNRVALDALPKRLELARAHREGIAADLERIHTQKPAETLELGKDSYALADREVRVRAAQALSEAIYAVASGTEQGIGTYMGFELRVKSYSDTHRVLMLRGQAVHEVAPALSANTWLKHLRQSVSETTLAERLNEAIRYEQTLEAQYRVLQENSDKPFEHEARLAALLERQAELNRLLEIGKGEHAVIEDDEEMLAA